MSTPNNTAPDFGEPWQNELGDFEIYPRTGGDATAYAEGAKTRDRVIACVNACAGMANPAAEIQAMRDERNHLSRDLSSLLAGDCLNGHDAVEGARNGIAMREAIKDAHYALAYVYNHGAGSCAFPFRTEDDLCSENRFHHVKDALDALQPFLKP